MATPGQAFWQTAVTQLLDLVFVIATPIAITLTRRLIAVLETKTGVDVAERHERLIDSAIEKGIAYAHEQSRKALKASEKPIPGDEKKRAALAFATGLLEEAGGVTYVKDTLERLIEAKLNMSRPADKRDTL
jgi:hypothetical protein